MISHVFQHHFEQKSVNVDLISTQNSIQLTNILAKAILPALETRPQKLLRWISGMFSGLKSTISFDSLTGQPCVELGIRTEDQAF